ncbi:MAG: V-type ATP synthase subunit D [Acholeplasmatales bacterium]|jgi:V/A-type H+-transporting ATPase subunit D|nr:V-type ATP synthase subunit D [Acholeplasmatales bacterium]
MSNTLPTKANLIALKNTYSLAKNGLELMDQKKQILINELLSYTAKIQQLRGLIVDIFAYAYSSLIRSNVTLGLITNLTKYFEIDDNYQLKYKTLMGVTIPTLEHQNFVTIDLGNSAYPVGLTNTFFDDTLISFLKIKDLIITLANIDSTCYRLALNIKKTNKRTNALKNIIIPNLEIDIAYVTNYLEEHEREEFSKNKLSKKILYEKKQAKLSQNC